MADHGALAAVARPIVVFDALCVLCSANAQFILRNDRKRRFRLASMQSETGAQLLAANGVNPSNPDTIIVISGGRVLRNSDAVLGIYRDLGWPWRAAVLLKLVPSAVRDPLYRWVARNRYRWFGKRDKCWVPAAADLDRML